MFLLFDILNFYLQLLKKIYKIVWHNESSAPPLAHIF